MFATTRTPRPQPTMLIASMALSGRGAVVACSVRNGEAAGSNPAALTNTTIEAMSVKGIPTGGKSTGGMVAKRAVETNAADRAINGEMNS